MMPATLRAITEDGILRCFFSCDRCGAEHVPVYSWNSLGTFGHICIPQQYEYSEVKK